MLSCMLVLVLAVMITPSQAFGPQPGSKGDYNPVTPQELEKYNLSLQNYLSDSGPPPHASSLPTHRRARHTRRPHTPHAASTNNTHTAARPRAHNARCMRLVRAPVSVHISPLPLPRILSCARYYTAHRLGNHQRVIARPSRPSPCCVLAEPIPGVTYAELVALGEPTKYRSQVVSGYKYYFEWDSGDVVEVWEQTWTDKMEIQTWHCLDNSAPPCKA